MENSEIRRGAEVELEIERLAFGGRGVSHQGGLAVFVEGALPGQKVKARVVRKRKGYAEARVLEVLRPSPDEVEARCRHFGECGGCRFQNLSYEAQVAAKRAQVVESLEHIGGFSAPPVAPVITSPETFGYRNKMEYSFGRQRWVSSLEIENGTVDKPKDFALGLHVRGRFDKILDIDECHLQSRLGSEILGFVRDFALKSGEPAYTTADHSGYWRHLVIREGKKTGDLLLNVVTAGHKDHDSLVGRLHRKLVEAFPQITTMVHSVNRGKAQVAVGEERVLFGPGTIKEKIGPCTYQISASSFFQTNTRGAHLLYDKVVEFANFRLEDLVFDLYAGAGTISIYIARHVGQVVGFELVADAIKDAQVNCGLNETVNCTFVGGDLKDSLRAREAIEKIGKPDVLLIDPPRAGMHSSVLAQVQVLAPERIVYVSCNPTTFARDARVLCDAGYAFEQIQPVDMFPMTPHIELVCAMRRA